MHELTRERERAGDRHRRAPAGGEAVPAASHTRRRPAPPAGAAVAAGVAMVAGMALFFVCESELWLDEALSVHIARLPVGDIPDALRSDGSPPLYYVLLHGWIELFGEGKAAVRSLSGLFSLASVPLMWLAGRRVGGRRAAWAAVILFATSPYVIHYATEARMYALLILLALLGFLALERHLRRPGPLTFAGIALVSGLMALTHYWAFYLLAATVLLLVARAVRRSGAARRRALSGVGAVVAGGLVFLPWLPSFMFQLEHTGTPWQRPSRFTAVFDTLGDFAGGPTENGRALLVVMVGLSVVALFGRATSAGPVILAARPRRPSAAMASVTFLTLLLGLGAGRLVGGAYAYRYAATVVVPFLLLVALGVRLIGDRRVRWALLGTAAGLGLVGGWQQTQEERTQAGVIAAAIEAGGRDGDVVAFCPDQLGPAVTRLLPSRFVQVTYPYGLPPERVEWVDYAERQKASNPTRFAVDLDRRAGPRNVWLVWAPGYETFRNYCEIVDRDLGDMRPTARVVIAAKPRRYLENAFLVRYPATCSRPLEMRDLPVDAGPNPCPPGTRRYEP